jgi:hypothetical protein
MIDVRRPAPIVVLCLALALVPGPGLAFAKGVASRAQSPLARLRAEVEQFYQERQETEWASWTGGVESRLADVYARHADLFTLGSIAQARAAAAAAPPADRKALTYLRRYLEGEFVGRQAAALEDSVANVLMAATVPADTGRVPYFQVSSWISNQADHAKRLAAYAAQDSLLDALKPLHQARLDLVRREAAKLGYASRFEFYQAQKGIRFADLEKEVRAFLAETQGIYDTVLTAITAQQLGMERSALRRPDVSRINRLKDFDESFPSKQLLPVTVKTFAALGVDVSRQRNIRVDAEVRQAKNPRAACFPVRVPEDIRISVEPIGGLQDYEALFHEMGHAEHAAYTRQRQAELRILGSDAFPECMAFAAEYLVEEPAWIRTYLEMDPPEIKRYASQAAFLRLMLVRRYAGKFLYEMDLHRGGVKPELAYARNMQAALLIPMDEHDARRCYDEDEGFYEADYLQAWFLEALLKARLRAKFGPLYFLKREAGDELKALWATGTQLSGPELARRLGATRLDHRPLARQLRSAIVGGADVEAN